jgi:hypothetical protein
VHGFHLYLQPVSQQLKPTLLFVTLQQNIARLKTRNDNANGMQGNRKMVLLHEESWPFISAE